MNDKEEVIYKGLINVKNHKTQFADFRNSILDLITKYKPDIIVMEEMKSSKNFIAVKKLGKFTGILQELCETLKILYYEIPIVSVNALLCEAKTSNGHGNKFDLCRSLCKKYGWEYPKNKNGEEILDDDQFWFFNISDATGFALYYIKTKKEEKDKK